MAKFKNFNGTKTVNENINTEGFEYHKLKEFIGCSLRPLGFIIHNKSKYGKSLTLVMEDCFINMPSYAVPTFESFTEEEIEEVKRGDLVITEIEKGVTENGETTFFCYDDFSENYDGLDSKALDKLSKK